MDVWIVLIEDRHSDGEALPFSTEAAAVAAARKVAARYARDPGEVEDVVLNQAMLNDGWVLYLSYGPEGDCVRVIRRTMDGGQ